MAQLLKVAFTTSQRRLQPASTPRNQPVPNRQVQNRHEYKMNSASFILSFSFISAFLHWWRCKVPALLGLLSLVTGMTGLIGEMGGKQQHISAPINCSGETDSSRGRTLASDDQLQDQGHCYISWLLPGWLVTFSYLYVKSGLHNLVCSSLMEAGKFSDWLNLRWRCFTSAFATSTSGCRLSISSRALVPPFRTPMIMAPGSRCRVALWEEEEEDDEEESAGELEPPVRNSLKHTDSWVCSNRSTSSASSTVHSMVPRTHTEVEWWLCAHTHEAPRLVRICARY